MTKISMKEKKVLTDALKDATKSSPVARFLHRLHCVLLISHNYKTHEVASWFGDDPSSVARWTRHFINFGVDGLQDDQKTGRLAKINYDQMQALAKDITQHPSATGYSHPKWDGRLLVTHLQEKYNIQYSLRQCQRLLVQLKNTHKKTDTPTLLEEVE